MKSSCFLPHSAFHFSSISWFYTDIHTQTTLPAYLPTYTVMCLTVRKHGGLTWLSVVAEVTVWDLVQEGSSAGLCHVTIPKLRAPFGHLCPLSHNLKTAGWPFCSGSFLETLISLKKSFPGIPMPLSAHTPQTPLTNKGNHTHDVTNTQSKELH